MRSAWDVACMAAEKCIIKNGGCKPWNDIKMAHPSYGANGWSLPGSCEHSAEPSGSTRGKESLE